MRTRHWFKIGFALALHATNVEISTKSKKIIIFLSDGFLTKLRHIFHLIANLANTKLSINNFLLLNFRPGTVNSVTKLASSVARNLDRLTLDEEHLQRQEESRRTRPRGMAQGLYQGLTGFGMSLLGKKIKSTALLFYTIIICDRKSLCQILCNNLL